MPDDFGSPNLDDQTAQFEEDVKLAWEQAQKMGEQVLPQVANRPIGTVKVDPQAQYEDWSSRGPTYWQDQFTKLAVMGPAKAMLELLKHDKAQQMRAMRDGT